MGGSMNRSWGQGVRVAFIYVILMGAAIVTIPSKTMAVAIPGFTGHAESETIVINYAVLSPFDAFASVLAGAYVPAPGNSVFDASKYTYLYQVTNPLSSPLAPFGARWESLEPTAAFTVPVSTTTIGAFASGNLRLDFLNGGTIVNATGNNLQGVDTLGIAARIVSEPEQVSVSSNPTLSSGPTHPYWGVGVGVGLTSPLVGYQSSLAPTFATALVNGVELSVGAFTSAFVEVPNAIPTSAPEPTSLLPLSSGAAGLMFLRRKIRQTRL